MRVCIQECGKENTSDTRHNRFLHHTHTLTWRRSTRANAAVLVLNPTDTITARAATVTVMRNKGSILFLVW